MAREGSPEEIERKSDGDPMVSALLGEDDEMHCPECGMIAHGARHDADGTVTPRCANGHSWQAKPPFDERDDNE